MAEAVGGAMPPAIGDAHIRPQGGRRGQTSLEEALPPGEGPGPGPLFSPRSRLWERAVRRPCSVRPEAARGGWPSSVSARRTAVQ